MIRLKGSNKSVSPAGEGLNIAGLLGRIAQRPPQFIHRGVQTVLEINERPLAPDPFTQLLAGDHFAGVCQQDQQDLKRLSGQPNANAALEQFPGYGVHLKRSECKAGRRLGVGRQMSQGYHRPKMADDTDRLPTHLQ